jgi:hypothetical protein
MKANPSDDGAGLYFRASAENTGLTRPNGLRPGGYLGGLALQRIAFCIEVASAPLQNGNTAVCN